MKAAAAVASVLKAEGTEYLFCFPVNALIDEASRQVAEEPPRRATS